MIEPIVTSDAYSIIKLNTLVWISTYLKRQKQGLLEFIQNRLSPDRIKEYQEIIQAPDFIGFKLFNKHLGIMGYIDGNIKHNVANIKGLYINPALQGFGFGKNLLNSFEEKAKTYKSVNTLELEVLAKNKKAIEFYKHMGFRQTKHSKDITPNSLLYKLGYKRILVMKKDLSL